MKKLKVGILFGGRSGEHEVSLLSAASVMQAIDKSRFDVVPIGITKSGRWVTASHAAQMLGGSSAAPESIPTIAASAGEGKHLRAGDPSTTPGAALLAGGESVMVPPMPDASSMVPFANDPAELRSAVPINVDVIFPVLHGTFGEDGTIQGLLELADIAYVGAGVLGSAAGMDKDAMKRLFIAAGLPIVKHVTVLRSQWQRDAKKVRKEIESRLKYPLFVKPANLGSSVGISKVHNADELPAAMNTAAGFDRKIVIEQGVGNKKQKAREIEVSVLGNDDPQASVAGEIVPAAEFYDYAAKYLDEGSKLLIPARLTKPQMKKVQQLAVAAFRAVDCSGLARVDFLMDPRTGKLCVNEINTMPGFTAISMYPKLWAASGVKYTGLITRLIELALERHAEKKKNQYSF
jgi:D-alanine-D-alanine ligase